MSETPQPCWAVQLPLAGGEAWYDVCVAQSPAVLAEVLRILVCTKEGGPLLIRIERRAQ